jgi:hypothetical protein
LFRANFYPIGLRRKNLLLQKLVNTTEDTDLLEMAPKKKPVVRQKKVIDLDTYSALDAYAITLNEYFKSLKRAGFSDTHAFWLMSDRESYPDWILPIKPLEKISGNDYEEDEDD